MILWNASYDNLLKLDMSEESHLFGYVYDITALAAGTTVEQEFPYARDW